MGQAGCPLRGPEEAGCRGWGAGLAEQQGWGGSWRLRDPVEKGVLRHRAPPPGLPDPSPTPPPAPALWKAPALGVWPARGEKSRSDLQTPQGGSRGARLPLTGPHLALPSSYFRDGEMRPEGPA